MREPALKKGQIWGTLRKEGYMHYRIEAAGPKTVTILLTNFPNRIPRTAPREWAEELLKDATLMVDAND